MFFKYINERIFVIEYTTNIAIMQPPKVQCLSISAILILIVLRAFGEEVVKYLFNSTGHFLSSFLPRHSVEKLNVD